MKKYKIKKDPKQKSNLLGTETRFKDVTKTKSTTFCIFPGPGSYQMIAQWEGKKDKKKKETKNYLKCISKAPEKSIYY